ncbi:MAG TPA: energy transducer TonB [Candidatus Acidoferrales bacterium]|nr:energy transducer TonB [Candidatus Acidoferrales bacterium]
MRSQNILFAGNTERAENASAHIILPPAKVEPLHVVFAESILEDTSAHHHRSPLDWAMSIGVHIAILGALLILPLYHTAQLDLQKFNLTFLAPPMTPPPAPPPALMKSSAVPQRNTLTRILKAGQLIMPSFVPKAVMTTPPADAAPPDDSLMGVPGGVPGGIPGGQVGGVLGGVLGGVMKNVPTPPPAGPAAVAGGPKAPVRVGGSVKPPHLLYGPDPEYPVLARQARLSGVVVIEAIIDEHGNVTGMRVVSGHPLLVSSALAAVSKRKYEPTVLDGEPTPIDLRVEVSFSFSS